MAIVTNRDTGTTNVVCIGLTEDEREKVVGRLQKYSRFIGCPALLPVILVDLASITIRHWHRRHDNDLNDIQRAIGSDHYLASHSLDMPGDETVDSLSENMKQLTGLLGSAAGVTSFLKSQLRICEFVLKLRWKDPANISKGDHIIDLKNIEERINFARNSLLSSAQQNNYNKEAVQAQIQTVSQPRGFSPSRTAKLLTSPDIQPHRDA